MASDNEPGKLLLPYLQRADELQKHEPLVAYYCRLYAMEKGLKIPSEERTKTTNSLLASLMKQLEKDKKSITLGSDDKLHINEFASRVFARADKQDRSGRADLNTAKTFYAASIFFEILDQFGPLATELTQQQKYALWKAADIRKALKEGRKPNPGPPNTEDEFTDQDFTANDERDIRATEQLGTPSPPDASSSPYGQINEAPARTFSSSLDTPDKVSYEFSGSIPSHAQGDVHDQSTAREVGSTTNPACSFYVQPYLPPSPPVSSASDHSENVHHYHQQSYVQDLAHQSTDSAPLLYPNFQSYPSFAESSLPSVPSHSPSFNQNVDTAYGPYSAPPATRFPSHVQYSSSNQGHDTTSSIQNFQHESNYMPPPEKIAEAQKAARFAVGSLAFDDVSSAIDYLRKSLNLLTRPSADH